jgi:heat shock protein HslJ
MGCLFQNNFTKFYKILQKKLWFGAFGITNAMCKHELMFLGLRNIIRDPFITGMC